MKRIKLNFALILFIALSLFFVACDDDENTLSGIFSDGAFITNEGAWGAGNGSVSFYSYTGDTVANDIFKSVNNRALGDVVQSLTVHNEKAYIIVNGSNKIEVVTSNDFVEYGVINNLASPRYFMGVDNNKAYVSQWGDNGVIQVIDLPTLSVSKTIDVGFGPEHMIYHNNNIYVANSGGLVNDNTISIIDPSDDQVIKTITLDGDSPRDFALDANGDIWVLCYGYVEYDPVTYAIVKETASKLIRINATTNEVAESIIIGENVHPTSLESSLNGNHIFYGGGYGFQGIFKMAITENTVPSVPLIDKSFYGFNIDPVTGNVFAFEAPYSGNGTLWRYTAEGNELGSYEVGVFPNGTSTKKTRE